MDVETPDAEYVGYRRLAAAVLLRAWIDARTRGGVAIFVRPQDPRSTLGLWAAWLRLDPTTVAGRLLRLTRRPARAQNQAQSGRRVNAEPDHLHDSTR